ncbi:hypothetical protein [Streptomyces sp. CNQ-509]|nr:hypothetical protein [Streptomyces sp. CNQ-509]
MWDATVPLTIMERWNTPLHDVVARAAAAGHREHSISALTEVLRKPARQA